MRCPCEQAKGRSRPRHEAWAIVQPPNLPSHRARFDWFQDGALRVVDVWDTHLESQKSAR
ncbi:MAG: hypothetical protein JWM89_903 [Acidimicrobiales bacterium]|nr:hypothetical protein [Acidimicrobiales bacterium]